MILLVDKPKGITSFDCIRILRKKTGVWKMGHAGTLDPLATGLMIIATDDDTKRLTEFLKLPKKYEAEIMFGIETDTGDVTGAVVREEHVPKLSKEILESILTSMKGDVELFVPIYSAIKRGGKPLYQYAREHESVEVPQKIMHIIDARLIGFQENTAAMEFYVKSGTYIRSLAEELARRLGTVAALKNLRRTAIGKYTVEEAEKI